MISDRVIKGTFLHCSARRGLTSLEPRVPRSPPGSIDTDGALESYEGPKVSLAPDIKGCLLGILLDDFFLIDNPNDDDVHKGF